MFMSGVVIACDGEVKVDALGAGQDKARHGGPP
jgi:hypothetical protein